MFASFMPLPEKPVLLSHQPSTLTPDVEKAPAPEETPPGTPTTVDFARYESTRWWRRVNRILMPVGLIIIAVVVSTCPSNTSTSPQKLIASYYRSFWLSSELAACYSIALTCHDLRAAFLRTLRFLTTFFTPSFRFFWVSSVWLHKKRYLHDLMTPYHLVFGRKRCTYLTPFMHSTAPISPSVNSARESGFNSRSCSAGLYSFRDTPFCACFRFYYISSFYLASVYLSVVT